MPDGERRERPPKSDPEFEGLSDEDCVEYQDVVWELIRWLDANRCGSHAGRLEHVMRAVPPLTEPPSPDPEPEMLALKPVDDVLDEIMIVPPGGLVPTQYKAMRRLRDRAKACVRHRLRKLGDDKAARDLAIEHVAERLQALPKAPEPLAATTLEFQPGAIIYCGHREPLSGKPWQVLKALAEARHKTLTLRVLQSNVWKDSSTGQEAVRSAVKTARAALRRVMKAAGVVGPNDPIPVVDRGDCSTAWRLALL